MEAKRDLQIAVIGAWYGEGEVIEDPLTEPLPVGEAVRRREVDTRLPSCGIWGDAMRLSRYQPHDRSSSKRYTDWAGLTPPGRHAQAVACAAK
jgi:hypothetical protein